LSATIKKTTSRAGNPQDDDSTLLWSTGNEETSRSYVWKNLCKAYLCGRSVFSRWHGCAGVRRRSQDSAASSYRCTRSAARQTIAAGNAWIVPGAGRGIVRPPLDRGEPRIATHRAADAGTGNEGTDGRILGPSRVGEVRRTERCGGNQNQSFGSAGMLFLPGTGARNHQRCSVGRGTREKHRGL